MNRAIEWVLGVTLVISVVALGSAIYSASTSEKITLVAQEWRCTERTSRTTLVPTGKTIIPIVSPVCIKYERN